MFNKTVNGIIVAGAVATCGLQAGEVNEWLEAKGDVRFRFENIDKEGSDTRERFRVRGRIGLKAAITDDLKAGFRLVSGSDDPVSTNQTLGDGFSSKGLQLDHAYLRQGLGESTAVTAGKMSNPFESYKGFIWDSDLSPEGVVITHEMDALSAAVGGFAVEENKSGDDIYMFGAQAIASTGEEIKGELGLSYYLYSDLAGEPVLYDVEDSFGNTAEGIETEEGITEFTYQNDYSIFEVFGKVGFDAGLPVSLYADYALNTEADDNDTAYLFGVSVGKAKEVGSWQFDYNFRNVEADAVLGVFSDSDSSGGGADIESSRFQIKYQLTKKLQTAATFFLGETSANDDGADYERLQLDIVAKF